LGKKGDCENLTFARHLLGKSTSCWPTAVTEAARGRSLLREEKCKFGFTPNKRPTGHSKCFSKIWVSFRSSDCGAAARLLLAVTLSKAANEHMKKNKRQYMQHVQHVQKMP
jgi:hypothetical protein